MPSTALSLPAPTITVTAVEPGRAAPFNSAVTSTDVEPASSFTDDGDTVSVTAVDTDSSSPIVSVVPVTVRPTVVVPVMETVSAPSPNTSLVGVSVNVPVPLVEPGAIVTVRSFTVA